MIHTIESLHVTGKVTYEGDCIIWNGALAGKGYPVVKDDRERYVHRLVALLAGSPIAPGEQSAHRCGRSQCINPEHVRSATQAMNEADKVAHGTARRGIPGVTHCGRHLGKVRCKRRPHDGPCDEAVFVKSYRPATEEDE